MSGKKTISTGNPQLRQGTSGAGRPSQTTDSPTEPDCIETSGLLTCTFEFSRKEEAISTKEDGIEMQPSAKAGHLRRG